ncbi:MAG: hypothetical protein K8S25_15790 [Alphaproteobacteria bacterium]|nr:hypothetical protein [Alphaproteobacteria bacterium]
MRFPKILAGAMVVAACGLLSACGGSGPSETEFVEACVKAPGGDEAMCKCTAREAKAKFSGDAWSVFALQSLGKADEASAIAQKMPAEEQAKMVSATLEIVGTCAAASP